MIFIIQSIIPKSFDEVFDILELVAPGVNKTQAPLVKTAKNFLPILEQFPDVIKALTPTLNEIVKSVASGKEPVQKSFARWGRSLWAEGGKITVDAIKAAKASPLNKLIKLIKKMKVEDLLSKFLEGDKLKVVLGIQDWAMEMIETAIDNINALSV